MLLSQVHYICGLVKQLRVPKTDKWRITSKRPLVCYFSGIKPRFMGSIPRSHFDYNGLYFSRSKFNLETDEETGNRSIYATEDIPSNEVVIVTPYYNHVLYASEQSNFCNSCHDSLMISGLKDSALASKHIKTHLYCSEACLARGEPLDAIMAPSLRSIQKRDPDFYIANKDTIKSVLFALSRAYLESHPGEISTCPTPTTPGEFDEESDATGSSRMGRPEVLKEATLEWADYERLCKLDVSPLNDLLSPQRIEEYKDFDHRLKTLLFDSPLLSTGIDPLDITLRDASNSFELDKYDSRYNDDSNPNSIKSSGFATFPLASYFNHNCSPNCAISFDMDANIVIRTTRPVVEGDELTISYDAGSLKSPVQGQPQTIRNLRRRCKKMCKEVWAFQCDCPIP